jgi:hypothetical protein
MFTFEEALHSVSNSAMFYPATRDFSYKNEHSLAEEIESLRFQLDFARKRMTKEINRCEKLQALKVLFGGYYKREDALR